MPNFGSNFLAGFQHNFTPTFNNVLRNLQTLKLQKNRQDFLDKRKQEELDRQDKIKQQDANISNQIRSGVENVNLPQVGNRTQQLFGIPNIPKQVGVPLNQQPDGEIAGKRRLFGDLSTQGQTRFNREQSFANGLLSKEQLAPPVEEFINADELPNLKKQYVNADILFRSFDPIDLWVL